MGREGSNFRGFELKAAEGGGAREEEAVVKEMEAAVVMKCGGGEVQRRINVGLGDHHD